MDLDVPLQVGVPGEGPLADITLVILVRPVDSFVEIQIAQIRKALAASFATEVLHVHVRRHQMPLQPRFARTPTGTTTNFNPKTLLPTNPLTFSYTWNTPTTSARYAPNCASATCGTSRRTSRSPASSIGTTCLPPRAYRGVPSARLDQ